MNSEYITKDIIKNELIKLSQGVESKSSKDIADWIKNMYNIIDEYREPYKCYTCKQYPCFAYQNFRVRNCNGWQ